VGFDILKFLRDHHIEHRTEGKQCRPGWVQVHCPFNCGYPDFHLGIKLDGEYGHCWRCRGKSITNIIQALLKCSWSEVYRMLEKYKIGRGARIPAPQSLNFLRNSCTLPMGAKAMSEPHHNYLLQRNFDPFLLERNYGLLGTDHMAEHPFRIIIPITLNGKLVSYQCRDYTGKVPKSFKYIACEKRMEVVHHKHILYGCDLVTNDMVLIVEGATDVWRLGPDSAGTFGTGFKMEQVEFILRRYSRVFIMFDPEKSAQQVAYEMAQKSISEHGIDCELVTVDTGVDPGDMKQDDANHLMRELGLKGWNG